MPFIYCRFLECLGSFVFSHAIYLLSIPGMFGKLCVALPLPPHTHSRLAYACVCLVNPIHSSVDLLSSFLLHLHLPCRSVSLHHQGQWKLHFQSSELLQSHCL